MRKQGNNFQVEQQANEAKVEGFVSFFHAWLTRGSDSITPLELISWFVVCGRSSKGYFDVCPHLGVKVLGY